ncbi:L,D-transpeptidase family protein [Anaerobacillus isosaccharinicus]|uniref:L,D-transpeptidase n=1 Tax=Anaerobacillus isosaccharinicus TaxID=1532552 RepID=A0A1S2L6G2_9BACI|nr:L,D-transpeptidase family protein [Anaerobacillus isosaccharinicus]MBA5586249.1 L,D-transpeptidase family protein [Anaerobacillus isosaccharinicus]QOY35499.1 L,D-transpeptidase family protein [Anaerobacillus isosaccharinicus]
MIHTHVVKQGETLITISEDYRIPVQTIISENQISNPNLIYVGQRLSIPGVPDPNLISYSIIVSISNRNLTLLKHESVVKTYPIAVGRILHGTPIGEFVVINKAPNPGGAFGTMWMSLSKKHYGIHGTNDPSSIGKAVSKGCIRMFNDDVNELASTIPIGTRVIIRP